MVVSVALWVALVAMRITENTFGLALGGLALGTGLVVIALISAMWRR